MADRQPLGGRLTNIFGVTDPDYSRDSKMRNVASVFVVAVCAGALFTLSSCGQATPPAGAAERKDAAADSAQPEPEDLLRRMANYLAALPAFACRVTSTVEIKAQGVDNRMETKIAVRLERPNRLSLVVEQGVMGMTVVSDGKQVVRYLPMLNQYVVAEAPADFAGLSDASTSMMPLGISPAAIPARGDEFYDALMNGVTKSEYLGTEKIGDGSNLWIHGARQWRGPHVDCGRTGRFARRDHCRRHRDANRVGDLED